MQRNKAANRSKPRSDPGSRSHTGRSLSRQMDDHRFLPEPSPAHGTALLETMTLVAQIATPPGFVKLRHPLISPAYRFSILSIDDNDTSLYRKAISTRHGGTLIMTPTTLFAATTAAPHWLLSLIALLSCALHPAPSHPAPGHRPPISLPVPA